MSDPTRPFLLLPPRVASTPAQPRRGGGGGPTNPKKRRQVQRLSPRFAALQQALDAKVARLDADPGGVAPEQVLVFETNGPVHELYDAIANTPGLEWLLDDELRDLPPDEDFHHKAHPGTKPVTARAYLVMSNAVALEQLLSVWNAWTINRRVAPPLAPWLDVFRRLRDVRRWGPEDRLEETGILDGWREELADPQPWLNPFEVELWARTPAARSEASARVRALVARAGGQAGDEVVIEPIAYHALLVRLPSAAVHQILADRSVELVQNDDIRLFRPAPQGVRRRGDGEPAQDAPARVRSPALGEPLVGLLDGLPLENHGLLAGRLVVDDPDDWAAEYSAASRQHGTAMASLILHGDLGARDEEPSPRRLYCRPILRPNPLRPEFEGPPQDRLWVDVIHRAIRGALEGEGDQPPGAPTVRVFNLSVGHPGQTFLRSMSPLARLLDWLAWKHRILFVVSAGNHDRMPIQLPATTAQHQLERATIAAVHSTHRLRRLMAPAETVNGLTVGALAEDASGPWVAAGAHESTLVGTRGLPSPLSALGRGYRRAVKPELLAPGGRDVFLRGEVVGPDGSTSWTTPGRRRLPPGQQVAAPSRNAGDVAGTAYTTGTSNAAALTSRAASRIGDIVEDLLAGPQGPALRPIPVALWIKTLLVHSAEWPAEAYDALAACLRTDANRHNFRDESSAFLGYGVLRPARTTGCSFERATLLGGGDIGPGEEWVHRVPVPSALQAFDGWRRLTITLSWFTPVDPRDQRYRRAGLSFDAPTESVLNVERCQVDGRAVTRGTVQHEVLERGRGAILVGEDETLSIPVTCTAEAPGLDGRVPYALAVTLEVAAGVGLPIYDEIRERLRVRQPIRP